MKKISEMTQDELKDYALSLEADLQAEKDANAAKQAELDEANNLNKVLQKRNNDLFLKVEQQATPPEGGKEAEPEPVQTCEDFAKNLKI